METPRLRFYLTGRVAIETDRLVDQREMHGRQGRLALVHLTLERHRAVPVDQLAAAIWGEDLPPSWDPSLRAVISKLRRVLESFDPSAAIASAAGCYQLLVGDAWVDVEAAADAVDQAEGALRRHATGEAWSQATVAAGIAGRPVLPGEEQPWVLALRDRLAGARVWAARRAEPGVRRPGPVAARGGRRP